MSVPEPDGLDIADDDAGGLGGSHGSFLLGDGEDGVAADAALVKVGGS